MENSKNLILAIVLSVGIMLAWQYFFPMTPAQSPQPAQDTAADNPDGTSPDGQAPAPQPSGTDPATDSQLFVPTADTLINIDTPLFHAVLSSAGGVLQSFTLKEYSLTVAPGSPDKDLVSEESAMHAPLGLYYDSVPTWSDFEWSYTGPDTLTVSGDGTATIILTGVSGKLRIVRELLFAADSYLIEENITVINDGDAPISALIGRNLAATELTGGDNRYNMTRVAYWAAQSLEEENDLGDLAEEPINLATGVSWTGIQNNYFLLASADAQTDQAGIRATSIDNEVLQTVLTQKTGALTPGTQVTLAGAYYLGPKKQALLEQAPYGLSGAINLGWFDFIAKPLLVGLHFFNGYVHNYGVSIILLTLLIKIVFWPLSQKSYKSMNQMKKLQPMMAKLKEKYKDDRQRMNQELMSLYKTYKVNPAGGCLPMMLQIPVFIGLYQALMYSIELRHASFIPTLPFFGDMVWLADLSAKDPYYITPLLMGATMFLQQKMSPSSGDPTQAKVMMFMPVIFTFLFLNFPAGLVVYWLVNNVLSILQQWLMLRKA